jgi:hypothetical protein
MPSQDLLQHIRKAKSSHIRWRSYAQAMIAGVPVTEDRAPVRHTDCEFGRWYYGEAREMLGHMAIFRDLEWQHEILHSTYEQIVELAERGEPGNAREHVTHLLEMSRSLLELLDLLETQVHSSAA